MRLAPGVFGASRVDDRSSLPGTGLNPLADEEEPSGQSVDASARVRRRQVSVVRSSSKARHLRHAECVPIQVRCSQSYRCRRVRGKGCSYQRVREPIQYLLCASMHRAAVVVIR